MANRVTAYLALGSNIGDRMAFLSQAEAALRVNPAIEITKASRVYETEPWPDKEKSRFWFLNQVLEIETTLTPDKLLQEAKAIEKKLGRIKTEPWGDREIDIDILLYNGEVIDTPDLQIPHRHIQDRLFVIVPLTEIAPHLKDPLTGRTFSEILTETRRKDDHKVTPFL